MLVPFGFTVEALHVPIHRGRTGNGTLGTALVIGNSVVTESGFTRQLVGAPRTAVQPASGGQPAGSADCFQRKLGVPKGPLLEAWDNVPPCDCLNLRGNGIPFCPVPPNDEKSLSLERTSRGYGIKQGVKTGLSCGIGHAMRVEPSRYGRDSRCLADKVCQYAPAFPPFPHHFGIT